MDDNPSETAATDAFLLPANQGDFWTTFHYLADLGDSALRFLDIYLTREGVEIATAFAGGAIFVLLPLVFWLLLRLFIRLRNPELIAERKRKKALKSAIGYLKAMEKGVSESLKRSEDNADILRHILTTHENSKQFLEKFLGEVRYTVDMSEEMDHRSTSDEEQDSSLSPENGADSRQDTVNSAPSSEPERPPKDGAH